MKSIIIIIAIFLVTLTAKADWEKFGELDSLYLGDEPITFSKYSPDYTKFVTYSAQDSTLRLWDLETGKVIKERKFKWLIDINWQYGYSKYEFDFESEYFYNYSHYNHFSNERLYIANFKDSLKFIDVVTGNLEVQGKYYNSIDYYLMNFFIIKNVVYLIFEETTTRYVPNPNNNVDVSKRNITSIIRNINDSLIYKNSYNSESFSQFIFTNGNLLTNNNRNYVYLNFGDTSLIRYAFQGGKPIKNTPNIKSQFYPLDINYNYLTYSDSTNNVKFFSKSNDQVDDLEIPSKANNIRNFKLVANPKYSMFYQDTNRLTLCDNQLKKLIDTINLPEGNIGYSDSTKYAYSFVNKTVYRNRFNKNISEYDDIFTDNLFYKTNDSITLLKNINPKDSNLIWSVNGNLYFGNRPKLNISKVGFYKVELAFERNGKKYTIQKDSLIKVVDSLLYSKLILPTGIEIVKPKGWSYKLPFKIKTKVNNTNYESYSWYLNDSLISNESDFDYKFGFCNTYQLRLEIASSYLKRIFNQEIVVLQDFQYNFSSTIGTAPLRTILKTKYESIYDTLISKSAKFGRLGCLIISNKNGSDYTQIYSDQNFEKIDTLQFKTIGIYTVSVAKSLYFNDWVDYYPEQIDTAIVVLSPSDIQDFAERKYIFKQDADGIYCQLEGEGEVSLYDNIGRLVRTYQIENERYIRKEDLKRGVYFLSIQTNGNVYCEKVLVE